MLTTYLSFFILNTLSPHGYFCMGGVIAEESPAFSVLALPLNTFNLTHAISLSLSNTHPLLINFTGGPSLIPYLSVLPSCTIHTFILIYFHHISKPSQSTMFHPFNHFTIPSHSCYTHTYTHINLTHHIHLLYCSCPLPIFLFLLCYILHPCLMHVTELEG